MTDYLATLFVSPSQRIWQVEEVSWLTAGVLHEVPESGPAAPVPPSELRRLNADNYRGQGQPLTTEELELLASVCRDAGLSELDAPRTDWEWGGHLEVFNVEAEARGWWAVLMPIKDPHHVARVCRAVTEGQHRDVLAQAIHSGDVIARMNGTMQRATSDVNASHLVLTRDELTKFCALLCIEVKDKANES